MVQIIPFEPQYAADVRDLNVSWLEKYFQLEPNDIKQLSDPQHFIIDNGGYAFLAKEGNSIVGTVSLLRENDHSFELSKMAVTPASRGKGISKLLMDVCIDLGKEMKWHRLFLYSNTILEPAIALYRKYGFVEIPLEHNSHYKRTNIKMELILEKSTVSIIDYADEYKNAFAALNLEWLDKFNLTEEPDLQVLGDPRGTIIAHGGYIYLAKAGDEIVGSAALIKEHDGIYELAKMSVAPSWRGKGISKILIEKCLAKARELGGVKLELFSNHQLTAALKLYENYGFRHVEVKDSPFETADVKMELIL